MASNRNAYRESIDPDYQRWGRKYPHFPGVSECVRLIQRGKATGAWRDIVEAELTEHARGTLPDLIEAFKANGKPVRVVILMVLENARLPESVQFLIEVLRGGDADLQPFAERALREINTPDSRRAVWDITSGRRG